MTGCVIAPWVGRLSISESRAVHTSWLSSSSRHSSRFELSLPFSTVRSSSKKSLPQPRSELVKVVTLAAVATMADVEGQLVPDANCEDGLPTGEPSFG